METKVKFVDLGLQYESLKDKILEKFDEISRRGAYVLTDEVERFEERFADYCGVRYALGVGNGTDAIILSLKALNIGQGDEVITVPNSFIATAGAIASVGAIPVFVDVKDDFNINPDLVEKSITSKTKAIMPVHLTGRPADMDPLKKTAGNHGLKIIEDCAQAIGARYKGKRVGSFADTGCFSLHPLKNLHVHGDGGFITTNNTELYDTLRKFRNHGLKSRDKCEFWGFNSRLDAVQAGIANIKLKYLDSWNNRHGKIAEIYRKELSSIVKTPVDKVYEECVYHNFIIRTESRDKLKKYLREKGIETKIHYPVPMHLQPAAKMLGYKEGDFPVAEQQAGEILSLPIYPELSNEQIDIVINNIKSFFQ